MAAAIRLSQQHSCSFDHLVGVLQKWLRDSEAKRVRGLEIDNEFELARQLHWQIARLGALENPTGVDAGLVVPVANVRSVAHETASQNKLARPVQRRNGMARCQRNKLIAAAQEESISGDE